MKKILCMMATFVALMLANSCKETPGLIYDVTATAEGQVEFTWFNGGAKVDGNAIITECNDTTKVTVFGAAEPNALPLGASLESEDADVVAAANAVNGFITVNGVEGSYKLTIKGYVKYGNIIFAIDEVYPPVTEEVVEDLGTPVVE